MHKEKDDRKTELFELSSGDWFVISNVVPEDPVSV